MKSIKKDGMTNCNYLWIGLIAVATGCSTGSRSDEQHASGTHDWAALDEFHVVMAESFHPFADSGNLEPAKRYAAEMAQLAAEWSDSELPEKVNTESMKGLLTRLKRTTSEFREKASTADDAELESSLRTIHDLFHEVQESWYSTANSPADEHEHH